MQKKLGNFVKFWNLVETSLKITRMSNNDVKLLQFRQKNYKKLKFPPKNAVNFPLFNKFLNF